MFFIFLNGFVKIFAVKSPLLYFPLLQRSENDFLMKGGLRSQAWKERADNLLLMRRDPIPLLYIKLFQVLFYVVLKVHTVQQQKK